jgi:hypothetical protein
MTDSTVFCASSMVAIISKIVVYITIYAVANGHISFWPNLVDLSESARTREVRVQPE